MSWRISEKALALARAPLFAAMPAETLVPVALLTTERYLDSEELLFLEGDLGDAMYVVLSGSVRVERGGEVIAVLSAGECVGEMAALDWEPRSATVIADEPTALVRLERNDLLDLLGSHPELSRNLAGVLIDRIRAADR